MVKKKKWVKPVLVILTRGRMEEAVLDNCKTTTSGSPYNMGRAGCQESGATMACDQACQTVGTS